MAATDAGRRARRRPSPRRLLRHPLRRFLLPVVAFEFGNVAVALLTLRVILLFKTPFGAAGAVVTAIALYGGYVLVQRVAVLASRRLHSSWGPVPALGTGVVLFLVSYLGFALTGPSVAIVALCFLAAGLGTGAVDSTEIALLERATRERGRAAEGGLAVIRAIGNFAASAVTGILWSVVSVRAALLYLGGWLVLSLVGLVAARHEHFRAVEFQPL
jgi:MFS family permease